MCRLLRIRQFSDDPECLLRVAVGRSPQEVRLTDGTRVGRGEPVAEVHFWSDHFLPYPPGGPNLAWAANMRKRTSRSLGLLAASLGREPWLAEVKAVHGEMALLSPSAWPGWKRLFERLGFQSIDAPRPAGFVRRFHDFWQSFLILGLVWASNPAGLRGRTLTLKRYHMWISRDALVARYANGVQHDLAGLKRFSN
jgi:hypothetical protein